MFSSIFQRNFNLDFFIHIVEEFLIPEMTVRHEDTSGFIPPLRSMHCLIFLTNMCICGVKYNKNTEKSNFLLIAFW